MRPRHSPLPLLLLAALAGFLGAHPAPARPSAAAPTPLSLDEIAPGVWAAVQPPELRFDDANTLLVPCAERGALLVDPPSEDARLASLIAAIRARGWTVGAVVATHWHGDHTQGIAAIGSAFGDGVERIGHHTLLEDVPRRAASSHAERVELYEREVPAARVRFEQGVRRDGAPLADADRPAAAAAIERAAAWLEANRDARFLAPTLAYQERLVLHRCGRRIELRHFRAHTRGDTVVHLPDQGVVATGDLLDDLPYVGHGYPRSWIASLEEIAGWGPAIIVPGHGPVLRGAQKLETVLGFLRDLAAQAEAAHARGATAEEAKRDLDLSRWRAALANGDPAAERFFDQTVGEAIERALLEAADPELP
ncbi:MAG TPA: MBL fold metallo-hydrolase [Thermoanaerobaculia bacterium]|nr:MBL fold metallo-hydrolase [Thermoanaerobaculia bacterium]